MFYIPHSVFPVMTLADYNNTADALLYSDNEEMVTNYYELVLRKRWCQLGPEYQQTHC